MGGIESNMIRRCVSAKPKRKKNMDDDNGNFMNDSKNNYNFQDETIIIKGNTDKYFTKEDVEQIKKKYPEYDQWIRTNTLEMIESRPKPKKIKWKASEVIGIGSYGRVIFGLNTENGQLMAVKQVEMGLVSSAMTQDKIKALEMEIEILSLLSHRNIVRYIGSSKTKTTFNIFLEYVTGGHTITSLLDKYGKFNENLIRVYTKQIIEGLEYLHVRNTIHRDIKGSNILVDNNGVCKLADFGTAKKISFLIDKSMVNSLRGTLYWMAPEVMKQKSLGRQSDIWSLGCTVIEMATAKPPWVNALKGADILSNMYQIIKSNCSPPIPKDLSLEAQDFLRSCLRIDPKERPNIIQLRNHKFLKDEEPMFVPIANAFPNSPDSPTRFTIKNLIRANKLQPIKAYRFSPNSVKNSPNTDLSNHHHDGLSAFKSTAEVFTRIKKTINLHDDNHHSHYKQDKAKKYLINKHIISNNTNNTTANNTTTNPNITTNQSPLKSITKKINKIDEQHKRIIFYESDKDFELSSDCKSNQEISGSAKEIPILNNVDNDKVISKDSESKKHDYKQARIKQLSKQLNLRSKSEIPQRIPNNPVNLKEFLHDTKKRAKEGFCKISEDDRSSPISPFILDIKQPFLHEKREHFNFDKKKRFKLNMTCVPIESENYEEEKINTINPNHRDRQVISKSTAPTISTSNDVKLITMSDIQISEEQHSPTPLSEGEKKFRHDIHDSKTPSESYKTNEENESLKSEIKADNKEDDSEKLKYKLDIWDIKTHNSTSNEQLRNSTRGDINNTTLNLNNCLEKSFCTSGDIQEKQNLSTRRRTASVNFTKIRKISMSLTNNLKEINFHKSISGISRGSISGISRLTKSIRDYEDNVEQSQACGDSNNLLEIMQHDQNEENIESSRSIKNSDIMQEDNKILIQIG